MQYTVLIDTQNPAGSSISMEDFGQMVLDGVITATTQVWQPKQGRWIEAQTHPDLSGLFTASLWDAWDEAADQSLSTPLAEFNSSLQDVTHEEQKTESIKEEPFSFVDVPPTKEEDLILDSSPLLEKIEDDQYLLNDENITEIGLVELEDSFDNANIDQEELPFIEDVCVIPLDEVKPKEENLLQPPPLILARDIPRRSRPMHIEKPKKFSFVRVAIPIVLGSLFIFGGLNYVRSLNEQRYLPPPKVEIAPQSDAKVWSIENEVREKVGEDIIPLNPESSLEDILHVELQRNGITSITIRASVTEWTGRKLDEPKKIDVRIRAESSGELDRDIATIGLIFGKYIEYYFMDVERMEVCFSTDPETYLCASLDPKVIRRFYLKRIEYDVFFTDVFSIP